MGSGEINCILFSLFSIIFPLKYQFIYFASFSFYTLFFTNTSTVVFLSSVTFVSQNLNNFIQLFSEHRPLFLTLQLVMFRNSANII
uniref:Uncharacterized protein n=1 Tax=Octopus bimaculoides TaxID=37653 RepID=A0A0L8GTX9_OCTBM